jgi:SAM-dependent methyltransferase
MDFNDAMLRRLAGRVPSASRAAGSMGRLPLRPGHIDLIIATNVLHLHAEPRVALAAFADALAPGGTLICSWPYSTAGVWAVAVAEWRAGEPLWTVTIRAAMRPAVALLGCMAAVRRVPGEVLMDEAQHTARVRHMTFDSLDLPEAAQHVVVLQAA